jgi:uroporphyrin-III C-methyltransferase / precorrin-2 dehydrogenase / sirohydrochlorin ferrochelatase
MPVKTHAAFAAAAIAAGVEGATPAVAAINAPRPEEIVITTTIAELPGHLAAAAVAGPAVVMIGRAFARGAAADETNAASAAQTAGAGGS